LVSLSLIFTLPANPLFHLRLMNYQKFICGFH
jgi:hypothetical protein